MQYRIRCNEVVQTTETNGTIQNISDAEAEISTSADFTDSFVLRGWDRITFTSPLYIRARAEKSSLIILNVLQNFFLSKGGGLSTEDKEAISQSFKAAKTEGNTVNFYVDSDTTGTPAFSFNFPEEIFLNQLGTEIVKNFSWSALAYPNSVNPNLDGKTVFVLAVKGDKTTNPTIKYSFVDMAKLVDIYTAADNTIVIDGYTVAVKISRAADNAIKIKSDGLHVDISGKVDKVTGKDLSTNDYTTAEKTKLAGIEDGAQVNVIESVKVNGTALTPASKAVNIDISGKVDKEDFYKVAVPAQDGTVTYNGAEQSPCWLNYDPSKMTVSGETSAINAGSYTVVFALNSGYKWLDGTSAAKSVTWNIQKAVASITPLENKVALRGAETSTTVTFICDSDAPISAVTAASADSNVAGYTISGNAITIYKIGAGQTSITLTLPQTANYNAATCNIAVKIPNVSDIYTTVLLTFEDDEFPDEFGHDITVSSGTLHSYSTSIFKFGTRSWDNNGKRNACQIYNLALGGQDFTIDCWYYAASSADQFFLFTSVYPKELRVAGSLDFEAYYADAVMHAHAGKMGVPHTTYFKGPAVNTWNHIAFVYEHSASKFKFFVNGVLEFTSTGNLDRITNIGISFGVASNYARFAIGHYYLDHIRVSDGIARWTENFTPPTAEDY